MSVGAPIHAHCLAMQHVCTCVCIYVCVYVRVCMVLLILVREAVDAACRHAHFFMREYHTCACTCASFIVASWSRSACVGRESLMAVAPASCLQVRESLYRKHGRAIEAHDLARLLRELGVLPKGKRRGRRGWLGGWRGER